MDFSPRSSTPLGRLSPLSRPSAVQRLLVVVAAVAAAMGTRALLDPWLGDTVRFVFAFPAVVLVGLFAGTWPAVATAVLCAAWAMLLGAGSAAWPDPGWPQLAAFAPAAIAVGWLCGRLGRAGQQSARQAAEPPAAPAASKRAASRWLVASMAAAAVVPSACFAIAAWQSYHEAFAGAATRVDRAMRIVHEHAAKVFETNEVINGHVANLLRDVPDELLRAYEQRVHPELSAVVAGIEQIQGVWIWDAQGRALLSSAVYPVPRDLDISGRDYFVHQRDRGGGANIGALQAPAAGDEAVFHVSYRRMLEQDRFAGIVSLALYPRYFTDFYAELARAEPSLAVTLLRADGTLIARHPAVPPDMATVPADAGLMGRVAAGSPSGQFVAESVLDDQSRLIAYRKLGGYPLYVAGGLSRAAILADWYRDIALLAAFTFPTALVLVYVSWVALQKANREFGALGRLRAEVARRTEAEEALRQAQKLEALGHMTGGVAHDVNNLLMVVNNNAHVVRRLLPEPARQAVEPQLAAIARAVGTGTRLTRQLLAFSRRQALRPEVIRLQDRLAELMGLIQHSVPSQIALSGQVEPHTAAVEVDPAELELALINVAVNAKDAMPDGGSLSLLARDAAPGELGELAGRFVVITVRDSGTGIAPEVMERVFEPFFTTKELGKGTGLGLSQVFGFCTQSGGTARVASQPGAGTTVSLYLPASGKAPLQPAPQAAAASGRGRVLLVEDNDEVADATVPLLQSFGYEVAYERSADAAARRLARQAGSIDAVLTDIMMPGTLDGLGLARLVRERHPGLGVVLMTGYSTQLDRALAEGFEVLPKPWDPAALAEALARATRRAAPAGRTAP